MQMELRFIASSEKRGSSKFFEIAAIRESATVDRRRPRREGESPSNRLVRKSKMSFRDRERRTMTTTRDVYGVRKTHVP